jgi:PAS domain S-box-containing protein
VKDAARLEFFRRILLILFCAISFSLAAGGYWLHRREVEAIKKDKYEDLKGIADLKASQILEWRRERLADARMNSSGLFGSLMAKWAGSSGDSALESAILAQFDRLCEYENFENVVLAGVDGRVLLSGDSCLTALDPGAARLVAEAVAARDAVFGDLFRCPKCGGARCDVAAPVFDGNEETRAVLLLRTDAEDYLFPLVESWPTPSKSAETILAARVGDDALVLNRLRHRIGSAMAFRAPLSEAAMPVVSAALGGSGRFEGRDYRGEKVLADIRAIPGTPWFMVAKVDASEILAEAGYRRNVIVLFTVLAILAAACAAVLLFDYRKRRFRVALLQAEVELRRQKSAAQMYLDVAGVMMLVLDPSGRVVLVNRKGCEILGRPEKEIVGANWFERFLPPGAREEVKSAFAGIVSGESPREYAENAVLCGDGAERIVAWHNALLRDDTGRITGVLSSGEDVTERKRAERSLEYKTNELRAIIESAADGILVIDLDSRVMYSNSRFAAMWRIPAGIVASGDDRTLLRFVLDQLEDPEGFLAKVRALYGSDRTDLDTIRFKDDRVFERFSCPMSDGGRIVGRIWNFRDVTERERSAEALKTLHRLLEETQSIVKIGGWEYDARAERITWTDEVYRIYGVDRSYDPNDVGSDIGFYSPESAPTIERAFKRAIDAGEPYDLELEFVRAGGERIWVRTVGRPVLEAGKVVRVSGTFMDITERKRAEEGLRKLSLAVEQSPASVVITDVRGNIEYVNPKFTEITGYSFADVRGKNPRILKSGETPAEEYRNLWETISSGREWRGEFHNKRKDGGLFWERATISPIRDAAGAVTHYIGIKEDVTAQKALEEQLRQSMKMESVGRLAGGVAHDFNNMLGVIIGNAEMALSGLGEESPLRSSLREILRAARRSADFSRQLLAFARKQLVSPEVLDLNETIPGMLEMLRRLIGENIELDWRPGSRLWPVKIDLAQIDQILVNLAVNARDAIAGVGTLAIETVNASLDDEFCRMRPGFQSGEYVMLSVSDTGAGLDPETIEHIFEPFFTTKEVGKGTGLGLATVYGIVKQNNGSIDVKSKRGAGTTFTIYLPRTGEARQEPPAPAGEPTPGVETVLVVEDEPAILKLAEKVLAQYGYKVLAAKAPDAALELVRDFSGRIDLLVTDVVMPGMNGRELRDEISRMKPGLKCLFMSGYTADVIAHQGLVEEGVNFLQKPFSVASLAKRVREALDGE